VKYINKKRDRSSRTILKFFEDSDFRYQAKKSHRTRYRDYFKKFYLNYCYFRDHDLIDTKIGEGVDKVVFELSHTTHKAVKIYKGVREFNQERTNYEVLLEYGLENIVPKMEFRDQYSIVDKALPFSTSCNRLRVFVETIPFLHCHDCGVLDDRILILDLGTGSFEDKIQKNLDELRKINRS